MKLVKLVGGILLTGAVMLVALPACGGATGEKAPIPTAPQTTATATRKVTPTPTSPTGTILPATPQPAGPPNSDLLAQGKLVFDKTAGGVGCAFCHGLDGKGGGVSGLGAPDIRGKEDARVRGALAGGAPLMSFIKLNDAEITAVVAYLQYLNEQP